ncbi:cytochrome P450 [Planobispora rosea]|uniref:Cytochrome P450 n=1 Tax=Planobispora rosea TaxID=35762 RepID=A0A8J3S666_PLARO|nr:cytochrome P450 [Planobispora rosea]GGS95031.1 cytochrome P450 [Planobispora rosea]GIH87465.1 cytochrome P450 [Planobispora rosea]
MSTNGTCPIHPFDLDDDGVNRPGPELNGEYHRIRDETDTGVARVRLAGRDVEAWLVTRYADVVEVSRNPVFSRSRAAAAGADPVEGLADTLLGLDAEDHSELREPIKRAFGPQNVAALTDGIRRRTEAQLTLMRERGEPADLLEAFALPVAMGTISDMLGVPPGDRADFLRWSRPFLGTSHDDPAEARQALLTMFGYLGELLKQRREQPTGDLLSQIAAANLPEAREVMLPISLIVGGWETTASSVAAFVHQLLIRPYDAHDTAYAYLVDHPEAVPGAARELERMFSSSAADSMPRYVTRDITLPSGARLHEGDIAIPSHDAANYDREVFPDPYRMDFARRFARQPLTFGWGPHRCVGQHLGHEEIVIAIDTLVRNAPGLRLAVPADSIAYKADRAVTGPVTLPVAWS